MKLLRAALSALALLTALPAWPQGAPAASTNEDRQSAKWLAEGTRLLQSKRPQEAIEQFDRAASSYEARYRDDGTKYYSARSQAEATRYLLDAADAKSGNAKVVSADWAYAYYLKAYALLELGRSAEAKSLLERALALAPRNSQFLSELGYIHQRQKDWPTALEAFLLAETAAKEFSPPEFRNLELSRAWRGLAFVYVVQNRLDDAEKMYRQCLDLDQDDAKAARELRYLEGLRAKQGGR